MGWEKFGQGEFGDVRVSTSLSWGLGIGEGSASLVFLVTISLFFFFFDVLTFNNQGTLIPITDSML